MRQIRDIPGNPGRVANLWSIGPDTSVFGPDISALPKCPATAPTGEHRRDSALIKDLTQHTHRKQRRSCFACDAWIAQNLTAEQITGAISDFPMWTGVGPSNHVLRLRTWGPGPLHGKGRSFGGHSGAS